MTFAGGEGRNCVLTGFTLTGGTGNYLEGWRGFWSRWGGGICVEPGASPTITRNIITCNVLPGHGGAGIWCGLNSQAHITYNLIEYGQVIPPPNSPYSGWGGGIYCENAYGSKFEGPTITHNVIRHNRAATGAAIVCGNNADVFAARGKRRRKKVEDRIRIRNSE